MKSTHSALQKLKMYSIIDFAVLLEAVLAQMIRMIRSTIYYSVVRHQCSGGASCNYPNRFSTDLFPHSCMGLHSH